MTPPRHIRSALFVMLGTLAIAGSVIGTASTAQAHNYLIASTPAAGSRITTLPTTFEITTNDDLLDLRGANGAFALQVRDSAGLFYNDGCVTRSGPSLMTHAALGAPGKYTVVWQVVSVDGHPVSGDYDFTWAPASGQPVTTGTATAPVCGAETPSPSTPAQSTPESSAAPGSPHSSAAAEPLPSRGPDGRGAVGRTEPNSLSDVLWIGGGVVTLAAVVAGVLVFQGRRASRKSGRAAT